MNSSCSSPFDPVWSGSDLENMIRQRTDSMLGKCKAAVRDHASMKARYPRSFRCWFDSTFPSSPFWLESRIGSLVGVQGIEQLHRFAWWLSFVRLPFEKVICWHFDGLVLVRVLESLEKYLAGPHILRLNPT